MLFFFFFFEIRLLVDQLSCSTVGGGLELLSSSRPSPSVGLQAVSPPGIDPSSLLFGYSHRLLPESPCLLLGEKLTPSTVAGWSQSHEC